MSLRDLLLGSVLSISLMMGTAVAQQSVGTAGTAGGTTGQGIATGAPTSLLNGQGGLSQGLQDRAPDAQIFSGTQLEGTNLFIEEQGGGAATATPSPMNAAGTMLDDGAGGGLLVDRPSVGMWTPGWRPGRR